MNSLQLALCARDLLELQLLDSQNMATDRTRREQLLTFLLLPAIVIAVLVLSGVMFRSSFQLEKLREQSVVATPL